MIFSNNFFRVWAQGLGQSQWCDHAEEELKGRDGMKKVGAFF